MMIRRLLLVVALLLIGQQARAQCPTVASAPQFNAGGSVFGRTPPQWNTYFQAKADANFGVLCNPTLYNATIVGGTPLPVGANPTAQVSSSVVDGVASTFMRSDAAPPIAANAVINSLLAQAAPNTIKGNPTGSLANEQDVSVPSCTSGDGRHLNYTSGSGFACDTSIPPIIGNIGSDVLGGDAGPFTLISSDYYNASGGASQPLSVQLVNNGAPGFFALPISIYNFAALSTGSTGNQVFAGYHRCEIYSTAGTCIGTEMTVANYSGLPPDPNLPPDSSIPTAVVDPRDLNLTCATGVSDKPLFPLGISPGDCSVALVIGSETGLYADPAFINGIFVQVFRHFGIVVAAQQADNQTSILSETNGTGYALQLLDVNAPNGNTIFTIDNVSKTGAAYITNDGKIYSDIGYFTGSTILMTSTVALSNDAAAQTATMTNAPAAGNPTKWITINDNSTLRDIPTWPHT